MSNGYDMIASGLKDLGNTVDPYSNIDIIGTLSKLFGGGKKETSSPDLTTGQIPTAEVKPQWSANNPFTKYLGNEKSFFARKETPQLMADLQGWEDKDKQRKFNESQFVNLTPEMIARIPKEYQPYYQPEQQVSRDKFMGLIPVETPVDPLEAELTKSQIFKNYQTGDNIPPPDKILNTNLTTANKLVGTYGGPGSALRQVYNDPNVPANIKQILLNRYNEYLRSMQTKDKSGKLIQHTMESFARNVPGNFNTQNLAIETTTKKNKKTGKAETLYKGKDGWYTSESEAKSSFAS